VNIDPATAVAVANPLGETLSLLQPSLLPALLEHAQMNLLRVEHAVRAFQWGHTFQNPNDQAPHPKNPEDRPIREETMLGVLLAVKHGTVLKDDPTLDLKQSLQTLLGRLHTRVSLKSHDAPPAWAHPGRTASISLDDEMIGTIGEVHPAVTTRFDLPARTAYCELSLSALADPGRPARHAHALPQFPEIVYDVTVPRTHEDHVGMLLEKLRDAHPLLISARVQDLYGKTATGSYNLTLRLTYRAGDRTLTEDETKKAHEEVMRLVETKG
jgi:phenylalanyl-tRNA synthetase beta chain